MTRFIPILLAAAVTALASQASAQAGLPSSAPTEIPARLALGPGTCQTAGAPIMSMAAAGKLALAERSSAVRTAPAVAGSDVAARRVPVVAPRLAPVSAVTDASPVLCQIRRT